MRHLVSKPKLSRTRNQRSALVKNLLSDFFLRSGIVTTQAKAKFIKPQIEHSFTIAKKGTLASYRQLLKMIGNPLAVKNLVERIAPTYTRASGHIRLTPTSLRRGDNTLMVRVSLVEKDQELVKKAVEVKSSADSKKTSSKEKSAKKTEAKKEVKAAKIGKTKEDKPKAVKKAVSKKTVKKNS